MSGSGACQRARERLRRFPALLAVCAEQAAAYGRRKQRKADPSTGRDQEETAKQLPSHFPGPDVLSSRIPARGAKLCRGSRGGPTDTGPRVTWCRAFRKAAASPPPASVCAGSSSAAAA
ncbi:NADH dehydrogenase [ubiquinone] 1 alpha subcomplex assembly factor 8 isoform X2 [Cuculus canorus]|uniref:NADH dehydrogenase [ubiquinone] 1 alpha subcomplex assembly factor 8 isoform X2 n=1 Tax=Cuculus canorus TaxID=55661 RepID=UPI0023AAFCDC|nr:NADH dehydrogenase [ubiquinone] 1 alpha subcomplex assembly factor 8 isoform X2 [Cuculus canorus]